METPNKTFSFKSKQKIKDIMENTKKSVKKEIRTIKNDPKAYLKRLLATALATGILINGIHTVDDFLSFNIVENPTSYSEEYTTPYLSTLHHSIGSNSVIIYDKDGNFKEVDPATLVIKSANISRSDIQKYNIMYRVEQNCELKSNITQRTKCMVSAGEYVIGKPEANKDGYIKVMTATGKIVGILPQENLTQVMDTSVLKQKIEEKENTHKNVEENEQENTQTHANYTAVNGEVVGIDYNPYGRNFNVINDLLSGTINLDPLGNISSPQIDYSFLKAGGFYSLSHKPASTEEEYIEQTVKHVNLCLKNNIPYGLYFYSTCITEEEAEVEFEFVKNIINGVKEQTGTYPFFPIGIDIEIFTNIDGVIQDRQYDAVYKNSSNKEDAITQISNAKGHLFKLLIQEFPDLEFMLYTAQNATLLPSEKIIDVETILDTINSEEELLPTLDLWWVSKLGVESHENSGTTIVEDLNGKVRIVMKQLALDKKIIDGQIDTAIDINVADEEWIKPYLNNFAEWNKSHEPQEASTKNTANNLTLGYITLSRAALYSFDGKHVKCMLDEGVQLLGKGIPDNNGFVSVVTRDGKSGKININTLRKVMRETPQVQSVKNDNIKDKEIEI